MNKQTLIIGGIAVAVVGIGVLLSIQDQKSAKFVAPDRPEEAAQVGEEVTVMKSSHLNPGATPEPYNSNPPTSGDHLASPANWGIYPTPLADEQVVHSLEHGGIWITYKDIDDQTKAQLETLAKANGGSVVLSPRSGNDTKIALASWGRLQKLDGYDEAKILEFISANKNKSPEPHAL